MFSVRLRVLAVATAAGLTAVGLTACAGSGSATESATAKSDIAIVPTLTGQTADDIFPIVDGAQITPFNQQDFQDQMWLPVLTYGGDASDEFGYDSEASLANQPVYSDNDTVVTLTLKHYKWSDGQPVTSRDVQFYYNLYVANKSYAGYYTPGEFPDNVKSFTVTGPYSIQLTLTRSFNPTWYTTNELVNLMALPQQTWDKTSASSPVGNYDQTHAGAVSVFNYLIAQSHALNTYATNPLWQVVDGPFRLKSFSTRGDIDLVPNPHYSGSPKPKIKELIERPFTSDVTEFNSLLAGTGLAYGTIPTQDNNQVKALERLGYRAFTPDLYAINYVVLNFNSPSAGPLFRQLYIRQALQRLINQPQDVRYAYNGDATPTYGPVPLAPASPYVTSYEKNNPYPFSTSAAESLLTSHGWSVHPGGTDTCTKPGSAADECGAGISAGKALSFRIVYASGDEDYSVMMQAFQSAAHAAGVGVELSEGEFNEITGITGVCKTGTSACNWDGVMYGGSTMLVYPSGNGFFNTNANGQGNYSSPEADQLINDTEYSPDSAPFDNYENYIAQQLPMLWMPWQQPGYEVVLKNLQGFTDDQDNPFADTFPQNWSFSG